MLRLPKRVTAANNLLCVLPKLAEEPPLRKHGVLLSVRNRYFYSILRLLKVRFFDLQKYFRILEIKFKYSSDSSNWT